MENTSFLGDFFINGALASPKMPIKFVSRIVLCSTSRSPSVQDSIAILLPPPNRVSYKNKIIYFYVHHIVLLVS